MKNTKSFKTTGLLGALSLTTLLAACGGGGGGPTAGAGGTVTPTAASALLQINGQNAISNTNTVTSLDQLFVTATVPVKWTFTATLPNGQPDTSIPTAQGGAFRAISSLPGTEPTPTQMLPASGTSFDLLAPPGDVVTLTLTDASTGTVVASYVFDVNSALAGSWPTMSYTQASGTYDVGNCSFTVSNTGVFNGSCVSSNVSGETFTFSGQQGWASSATLTGSNGWIFSSSSAGAKTISGTLGSAGSWTASR